MRYSDPKKEYKVIQKREYKVIQKREYRVTQKWKTGWSKMGYRVIQNEFRMIQRGIEEHVSQLESHRMNIWGRDVTRVQSCDAYYEGR